MRRATVVYWQGLADLPVDGGGLRVRAWCDALAALGLDVDVVGLQSAQATAGGGPGLRGRVHAAKRAVLPLPRPRALPGVGATDLLVAAVPAVVGDLESTAGAVVVDWMDLWSDAAATWAARDRPPWTRLGAAVQGRRWAQREDRAFRRDVHTFAGHGDLLTARGRGLAGGRWLPTPVADADARTPGRRGAVGMIANFAYPPNAQGLHRLVDRWGPELTAHGVEIVVAGHCSDTVAASGPVTRLGWVDDPGTFYERIDLAVVPVELGGGIKVKAVEALRRGVAVAGTDHVRAGFRPDLAAAVRPLVGRWWEHDPVDPSLLDLSAFTAAGFTARVRGVLAAVAETEVVA